MGLARILGPREQIVNKGSTITLTCEIRSNIPMNVDALPPPVHYIQPTIRQVDWLFEGQLLNYQVSFFQIFINSFI